ncbi:hypothetical protein DPMN_000654 [Dreissena polymorpha]|uniref:Uncharacterized protein n=1 Tax=Dreissena polymorpha TaxID=45954 RepID=A0A9D4MJF2_DREPO|nr:hypothetical protein DPMN_000654 [Dreissena polymorpha]
MELCREEHGPVSKTSVPLCEMRSKRQEMLSARGLSADSEKEKQIKRVSFRKHFHTERSRSDRISRVRIQNRTASFTKSSSNTISDSSEHRFEARLQSHNIVNFIESLLQRDTERHHGSHGASSSLLSAQKSHARRSPNAQSGIDKRSIIEEAGKASIRHTRNEVNLSVIILTKDRRQL